MEEVEHPPIHTEELFVETPAPPPSIPRPVAPTPAPAAVAPSVHPQLKSLLLELLSAVVTIAERVDADHEGVQTAVQTLQNIGQHLRGL